MPLPLPAQVAEAQAEVEALRRLVKLKTRELKNTRRLAQEVLLQRSDVETFLLSSLHTVRREVERDSVREVMGGAASGSGAGGAGGAAGSVFLTGDAAGASGVERAGAKGGEGGGMDLRSLSWADRERVLKLLFAKINNQAQQQHYANLPPHVLSSEGGG